MGPPSDTQNEKLGWNNTVQTIKEIIKASGDFLPEDIQDTWIPQAEGKIQLELKAGVEIKDIFEIARSSSFICN